ncbi:MAG: hypothetical protein L6R30_26215 [Thermoanaerobaculia bacterium]|nr:hypothetical protein [Thermoanaerobaculia bacterium]
MDETQVTAMTAEPEVLAEAELLFVENDEIGEGLCSCVCINDERCCGCLIQ